MVRPFMASILLGIWVGGCGLDSGRLEPNRREQAHLQTHLESIFAQVQAVDADQLAADSLRVRHIERLGYLAHRYHEATGHYPFASPDSSVFRQTLIGEEIGNPAGLGETYVSQEELLSQLREVLGKGVSLPTDPIPELNGARAYAYGVYGHNFVAAAMLYHPVGWSEGVLPHQWQYRVGAVENLDLPILQVSSLLAGAYSETRPARWRDPTMVEYQQDLAPETW